VSDNIRDMVEDNSTHSGVRTARNMADAANSEQSLMGYAAVNDADPEVAELAYRYFEERQAEGREGTADDDWFQAEAEVRRTRGALNA
jgi:hypothetical protein